jgi:hypothetical protein
MDPTHGNLLCLYNRITPLFPSLYRQYADQGFKTSTELNMAIIEFFYANLPFYHKELQERAINITSQFYSSSSIKPPQDFTVYHGTPEVLHGQNSQSFQTYAFFSTTLSIAIAQQYGNIIYKIKVPTNTKIPYLNISDNENLQILFPTGTIVKVTNPKPCNGVYECIIESHPCFFLNNFKAAIASPYAAPITPKINSCLMAILDGPVRKAMDISGSSPLMRACLNNPFKSTCGKQVKKQKQQYIIKDVVKKICFHKDFITDDYILRRIINEIMASLIVRKFYQYESFQFYIVKNMNNKTLSKYLLASDDLTREITYPSDNTKILNTFIMNCIISDWDAYVNQNTGILNNGNVIRTDVGGALAYRALGEFRLSFMNYSEPRDHITIFEKNSEFLTNLMKGKALDEVISEMYGNVKGKTTFDDIMKALDSEESCTNLSVFADVPQYVNFIASIIKCIEYRHNWYVSNKTLLVTSFLKQQITKPEQSGGASYYPITSPNPQKPIKVTKREQCRVLKFLQKGSKV